MDWLPVLKGGPYAVYPIIKSLAAKGAHFSVVISMLLYYGAVGLGLLNAVSIFISMI